MRSLVERAQVGHLATVRADGRPHVVPVCFVLLDDVAYTAVDQKPKRGNGLRRLANIEATGGACLLLDEYHEDWSALWWIRLDGRGRVVHDAGEAGRAVTGLVRKYPQYRDQPPNGPVIAVDITAWTGWSAS
jgi:PPOX class probable F420-dependent enzyme